MNVLSLRSIVFAAASTVALASIGCAAQDDEQPKQEGVQNDEAPVLTEGGGGGGSSTSSSSSGGTTSGLSAGQQQHRVTALWQYVVGGSTFARDAYPCNGYVYYDSTLHEDVMRTGADALRRALGNSTCTMSSPVAGTAAGLPAGLAHFNCGDINTDPTHYLNYYDYMRIAAMSSAVNACWPGATLPSYFWRPEAWQIQVDTGGDMSGGYLANRYYIKNGSVDPEPAHLNGSLYGNGSAASATFINTGTYTYGYQWPSSWAVGSVPAGAPCATYSASAGTTLYSFIQASGSYRKCY